MENKIIYRYGPPSSLDHAPLGTECHILKDEGIFDLYVQAVSNEEEPVWIKIGSFDDTSYEHYKSNV